MDTSQIELLQELRRIINDGETENLNNLIDSVQDVVLARFLGYLLSASEDVRFHDGHVQTNESLRRYQKNYQARKIECLSEIDRMIERGGVVLDAVKCFVSYKWQNDEHNLWVERLASDLRHRGIDAQLDRWELRAGDSLSGYMASRIDQASVVLCIITDEYVKNVEAPEGKGGATKFEMQLAVSRSISGESLRIIGVYKQGSKQPYYLRDNLFIDFRDQSSYEEKLKNLVEDILGISRKPPLGSKNI